MKLPFDPPTVQRKDVRALSAVFVSVLFGLGAYCAAMRGTFYPDKPYWHVLGTFLLSNAVAWVLIIFVVRPLRGMPPLIRKRPQDDFETWLTGYGFRWGRLRERYSTNELIWLFGVLVVPCVAAFVSSIRM